MSILGIIIAGIAVLCIGGFLVLWYKVGKALLFRVMYISNNVQLLVEQLNEYSAHLKSVYELDLFYGDQTLKSLLEHSKQIQIIVNDFNEIIGLPLEDSIMREKDEQTENDEQPTTVATVERSK